MKIELKSVKVNLALSEETNNFSATVYIDGKCKGAVRNHGQGGCNFYDPRDLEREITAYAKTLPPMDLGDGMSVVPDADCLIGELVDEHLRVAEHKRKTKTKVLYRIPGHAYEPGEFHVAKAQFSPEVKAKLEAKYPGVFILNENIGAKID